MPTALRGHVRSQNMPTQSRGHGTRRNDFRTLNFARNLSVTLVGGTVVDSVGPSSVRRTGSSQPGASRFGDAPGQRRTGRQSEGLRQISRRSASCPSPSGWAFFPLYPGRRRRASSPWAEDSCHLHTSHCTNRLTGHRIGMGFARSFGLDLPILSGPLPCRAASPTNSPAST